jgi:hypothetical protein
MSLWKPVHCSIRQPLPQSRSNRSCIVSTDCIGDVIVVVRINVSNERIEIFGSEFVAQQRLQRRDTFFEFTQRNGLVAVQVWTQGNNEIKKDKYEDARPSIVTHARLSLYKRAIMRRCSSLGLTEMSKERL